MNAPEAPSYVGQLIDGARNTPLYRLTVRPERLELTYRTEKVIAADEVDAIEPWRLPLIGWFTPSGVRIRHRSKAFSERLVFKTFRVASLLDAFESAGYTVRR